MAEIDAFERRLSAALLRHADEVSPAVDAAAVAHRVALEHPRPGAAALPRRLVAVPRLAWLLLAVALLAALAAGLLVVGSSPRHSATLVATGVDVLTPATGSYQRVVADGMGVLWAREEDGRLVRFDPASGSAQTWTISDDRAFAAAQDIAPAAAGGVWLVEARTLRWFDGERFRATLDTPAEVTVAAEAPDGSVWAATTDAAVLHWDGSAWSTLDPGRPNPDAVISAIAVDAAGGTWLGWAPYLAPPWVDRVSRYDGSSWTTFGEKDAAPLGSNVSTIVQLPDGAVWVATSGGLARFDGSAWTDATTAQGATDPRTTSVAAGPDGATWAAGGDSYSGAVTVRRFDGRSWTTYGSPDGLPGPDESGFITAWAVPTKSGVYVGTGAGIYGLSDDRWQRTWPPASAPIDAGAQLAVSRDELWGVGDGGLWHYSAGAWTLDPTLDPHHVGLWNTAIALSPDGTVWAADQAGVAYRRNGAWVFADTSFADISGASAIAVGRDGTVLVSAGAGGMATLRFDGTAWVSQPVAGVAAPTWRAQSLAIDGRGTLWAAAGGGYVPGGLSRHDGQGWEAVREIGGSEVYGATVLGTAPNGDVWVEIQEEGASVERLARFDGTAWTVVAPPDDNARYGFRLAPDGTVWTSVLTGASAGLARYDGQRWTFPYPEASVPWLQPAAVAPDGTLFASLGGSVVRLSARTRP